MPMSSPIMAVDDGGEMPPSIPAAVNVGHVHRPAGIALGSNASPPSRAWPWGRNALRHEPAVDLADPVNRFCGLPLRWRV